MSSYKNYLVKFTLLLTLTACAYNEPKLDNEKVSKNKINFIKQDVKYFNLENQYIMFALEFESQKKYQSSRKIYLKLFENTNKYEYLVKYLNLSFVMKDYEGVKEYSSLYMLENIKEEEMILKLYTLSLLKLEEKDETIKYAKKLVNKFYHKSNHSFLASIYLDLKDYNNAIEEFEKAYKISKSVQLLQTITNLQYNHLNLKKESKSRILKYIKKNDYPFNLSLQLLSFYEIEKDKEQIILLLEKMYSKYSKMDKKIVQNKTKSLLIRYLIKEDREKAILFLESNNIENNVLVELYKSENKLYKANLLLSKLYNKTNNLDYLAEQAMIEFEIAKNKQEVLPNVISKFDKVLQKISNPIYENYLAYILIDYNLDIERGLVLVKKALIKEPTNLAFIDTLAWGFYKNKDCKNAYLNMKKIVDKIGLEDIEIKLHWKKIKECVK